MGIEKWPRFPRGFSRGPDASRAAQQPGNSAAWQAARRAAWHNKLIQCPQGFWQWPKNALKEFPKIRQGFFTTPRGTRPGMTARVDKISRGFFAMPRGSRIRVPLRFLEELTQILKGLCTTSRRIHPGKRPKNVSRNIQNPTMTLRDSHK